MFNDYLPDLSAMKKLFLVIFILVIILVKASSQSCLPEGITFSTQAQIDSFQVNYPGCTSIEGDVIIYGNDISDLAGISMLDSIFGDLEFQNTQYLSDMTGLSNLSYIGGSFYLDDLAGFFSFAGLDNLKTVAGDLHIGFCDELTSLSGLENLTSVEGSVEIDENWELTSLTGLGNLTYIGGWLQIGYLWGGNPSLASLSGLDNLTSIGGGLIIAYNEVLTSLMGLDNVTSIGGDLGIYNNASLTSLSGLENVNASSINRIWIYENPVLTECQIQSICEYLADLHDMIGIYNNGPGCDNPHEIADSCGFTLSCLPFGNYYFMSQANVDSFPSYYLDCHKLEGYIEITGENITNLECLSGIDTINGSLHLCGNNSLLTLNGLNNLRTIQGDLMLGYWECGSNPALTDLAGLNKLTTVGGWMLLLGNSGLLSLSGLDSLTSVGQEFGIYDSPLLKNLNGINKLDSVQSIKIAGNNSMISLDGLQSLIHTNSISIIYNPMLITLDGIENVDADHLNYLHIHDNDSLTECNVRSVCDYLINYSGLIDIYNNNTGCDSAQEVKLACGVGVEEVISRQSLVVSYPNPFTDQTTFTIHLRDPATVNLVFLNDLGQVVATVLDESLNTGDHQVTWDAEGLNPGIYFYRLTAGNQAFTGKMVMVR